MAVKSLMGTLVIPCFVGGLAGFAVIADRTEGVRLQRPAGAFSVLAGVDSPVDIGIENRHWWRSATIEAVRTSCGCVEVSSFDAVIGARGKGWIHLTASSDPGRMPTAQVLEVQLADGRVLSTRFEVERRVAFAGWPTSVQADRDGGRLVVAFDRAYAPVIADALVLSDTEGEIPVVIDRSAGTLTFDGEGADGSPAATLLLTFGDDDVANWAGEIRVDAVSHARAD